jgi:predicted nucleotidyltransferase
MSEKCENPLFRRIDQPSIVGVNGYFQNPCSLELISAPWKGYLSVIINEYNEKFSERIIAIYIRGSVVRGTAVLGASDIDSFCIVADEVSQDDREKLDTTEEKLNRSFKHASGVEMCAVSYSSFMSDISYARLRFLAKIFSLCVYGRCILHELPDYLPSEKIEFNLEVLPAAILQTKEIFLLNISDKALYSVITWISKIIIRAGYEHSREDMYKYHRDIFPCMMIFSEKFPQVRKEIYKIASCAIGVIDDLEESKRLCIMLGDMLLRRGGVAE